jgi:dTDP-4-amino-4,6-dideoxygalactose transaminase
MYRVKFNDEVRSTVSTYLAGEYEPSVDQIEQFEQEFAKFFGMSHCVVVSSGAAALHIALVACGIGLGDEVVTIANACTAVSDAVLWCKAKPVFVDVEPETYNINPDLIEPSLTQRTKAIIPVHLYGHPVDMDRVKEIAERHSLLVVEDAAQAAGAIYRGRRVGTLGYVGIFSLSKNLSGFGGAVVTNDEKIFRELNMLRHFGRFGTSDRQEILGYRYTLSELDALINRIQLKYLDSNNGKRRQHAQTYRKLLADLPNFNLPDEKKWAKHVYHRFVPMVRSRNELVKHCLEKGVRIGKGYSIPVYSQGAYKDFALDPKMFPITERLANEGVSLPIHPGLKQQDLNRISETIHNFYK